MSSNNEARSRERKAQDRPSDRMASSGAAEPGEHRAPEHVRDDGVASGSARPAPQRRKHPERDRESEPPGGGEEGDCGSREEVRPSPASSRSGEPRARARGSPAAARNPGSRDAGRSGDTTDGRVVIRHDQGGAEPASGVELANTSRPRPVDPTSPRMGRRQQQIPPGARKAGETRTPDDRDDITKWTSRGCYDRSRREHVRRSGQHSPASRWCTRANSTEGPPARIRGASKAAHGFRKSTR